MSEAKPEIRAPTKKEVNKAIQWVLYIVPALIEIFAIVTILNIKDCKYVSNITYVLVILYHALRFYNDATSFKHKGDDSIFKTILYSIDIHIIVFAVAFIISQRRSLLFFVAIALKEIDPFLFGIYGIVKSTVPSLEETIEKLKDAVKSNVYLARTRAVIEILLLPYLFFVGIITFSAECFMALAIYFVGYILFMYLIDDFHQWVYGWISSKLSTLANQNSQSFGPIINQLLDLCRKVGDFGRKIYPDANSVLEIIKRKIE
jgi:hypothetical protein